MRVALIVNNPGRDLAGMTLLARELAASGATVFLSPMALQSLELGALEPEFVLVNQLRGQTEPFVQRLIRAGITVGLLDDEGGVFPSIDWYGRQVAPDGELRKKIRLVCSWGPVLGKEVVTRGWYQAESVRVTGHPRFDYYSLPWREAAMPDAPDTSRLKRPLVLINTRFSRVNSAFADLEEERRVLVQKRGYSAEQADEILRVMQIALKDMVALTNHLAPRFPNIQFVFRPHPFEKLETYTDLLEQHPNLLLTREGDIASWLAVTDALIHRSCTTAIEGGMRGIPALSPAWIAMPEPIESTEVVSNAVASLADMEAALQALERDELTRPVSVVAAHEQVVTDWFCAADGLSHQRVAAEILRETRTPSTGTGDFEELFYERDRSRGWWNWQKARRRTRKYAEQRTQNWRESDKCYDAVRVQRILDALQVVDGRAQTFKARSAALDYRQAHPHGVSVTVTAS